MLTNCRSEALFCYSCSYDIAILLRFRFKSLFETWMFLAWVTRLQIVVGWRQWFPCL